MLLKSDGASLSLKIALATPLVAIIIVGICVCPLYIKVSDGIIKIKTVAYSVNIPIEKVIYIGQITGDVLTKGTVQTFGSGGYFGYVGRARNEMLGKFTMYTTETKNLVLIRTDKTTFIVSSEDHEYMVATIKEQGH
jgi:hypothetical protein